MGDERLMDPPLGETGEPPHLTMLGPSFDL
jgi:hypothetical protein